jgi:Ca-activated chloride channel family protein
LKRRDKVMSQSRFEPTPKASSTAQSLRAFSNCARGLALALVFCSVAMGQAGRRPSTSNDAGVLVNVVAKRVDSSPKAITARQLAIYDNGIEQTIRNLTPDPSPARIVLLVDNSLTLRADVDKLEQAAREFAYEIYEGDKLLIVGYDEQAEIVVDWTDDAKSIEASLKLFRKKGQPHLFDAATAVIDQALRATPGQKRVIVVISDGLDRGSKTTFDKILAELQRLDITVYAVQAQDRTRGAIRRDVPKPKQVIDKLVEGTGGAIFSIEEPAVAAKAICDELRKNRYVLSYVPSSAPFGELRNLLVVGDEGITVRSKTAQQPN